MYNMNHLNSQDLRQLCQALRDFFASTTSLTFQTASSRLFTLLEAPVTDYLTLEYKYNHLFIGPGSVIAPPYASVYLESEPQLMGKSTLEIRAFYQDLGFGVPDSSLPDDHLAFELDAWLILNAIWQENPDNPQVLEAVNWFFRQHIQQWLPAFLHKALPQAGPLKPALQGLNYWFEQTQRRIP